MPNALFHRSRSTGSGFRDSEMQRALRLASEPPVCSKRKQGIGGLDADLEIGEIVIFQHAGMAQSAFNQSLRTRLTILLQKVAFQGTAIDANAHGAAIDLRRSNHFADPGHGTDIARVDTEARRARFGGLDRTPVMKMDVRHDRHGTLRNDLGKCPCRVLAWAGNPDNIRPGLRASADLRDRRACIRRRCVGHGLHGDRRAASDLDVTHTDWSAPASLYIPPRSNTHRSGILL